MSAQDWIATLERMRNRILSEVVRPAIEIVSVEEYAVHCVCAFLRWGNATPRPSPEAE